MERVNIFLGGTCADTTWRSELIPMLEEHGITYFNPVVDDWTEECQEIEDWHKENDDYNLFVITKEMKGVFSIAEVIDLSNKIPDRTILCILYDGFDKFQVKSLKATEKLAESNGAIIVHDLQEIVTVLIDNHVNNRVFEIKPDSEIQERPISFKDAKSIFFAGTIDMGNSENWQEQLKMKLSNSGTNKLVIYNPRRDVWPENDSEEFEYQVNWELEHLEDADFIIMYIAGNSKSPISLLELGLFSDSQKLLVICEEDFYRYGNVRITCNRYDIPLYTKLEDFINEYICE